MRIELYHGTDYEIAQKIVQDKFIAKKNDEHWLGNGIYFYIDKALAKWWTEGPTQKHGSEIKNPAIIKAALNVTNERVLDLRKRTDFDKLLDWEAEYRTKCIEHSAENSISMKKYRCALFDDIFNTKGIDVIIGGFNSIKLEQPYNNHKLIALFNKLQLTYTEIQVCVKADCQKEILKIIDVNSASIRTTEDKNGKAI